VNRPDATIYIEEEFVGLSYLCKRGREFFAESKINLLLQGVTK